jgi:predicted GNAT family N-acyltransferase
MSASPASIRWASDAGDLAGALALREEVFCGEQGVPREEEIDGLDGQAQHLVAVAEPDGQVIATLRVLSSNRTARIGRVAVRAERRREGIALRMLLLALERARELGCERARLAAQLEAKALYERAGFAVESEHFMEAGIEHVWMGRLVDGRGAS